MKTESAFGLRREAKRHAALGKHNRLRKAVSPLRSSLRCASPRQAATALQNMTSLLLCVFALMPLGLRAATNDLTAALQKGLFEEEANRNLDAAISNYQALAMQFDRDRQIAATAIFRLGECYRKLGQTNDAVIQYERIIREFSDQKTLATLSRQNLTGLESVSKSDAEKSSHLASPKSAAAPAATVVTDDEEQEIRRIRAMIQNSPDLINAPVKIGDAQLTPLGHAANNGQLRVAQFLLDSGAEVNRSRDFNSWPPLLIAASSGHKAMVELLLAKGADMNSRDGSGQTALHLAAKNGFQSVAEVLLANKADVNARDGSQSTPLHEAAVNGHADVLTRLLSASAKPDSEDDHGRTALSYAVEKAHSDCVKALLTAKADPNAGKLDAPLLCAIHKNDAAIVELLLQAGANPNAKGSVDWQPHSSNFHYDGAYGRGWATPLWLAVDMNQFPMVQLLLKFKADPNDSRTGGQPLLFSALSDTNILEALLDAGADPNQAGADGEPPLVKLYSFSESSERNVALAKLLIAHGAKVNVENHEGYTPLDVAVFRGDRELTKLLLASGANVNARRSSDGNSVLRYAAGTDNRELVELLLANNPDVNMRNNEGKTPLDYAKANGSKGTEIVALLRQYGARDNLPNWDRIAVNRASANFSETIFRKGTNDWNRFTLLELIAKQYGFVTDQLSEPSYSSRPARILNWINASLPFPDFKHVVIHRSTPDGRKWTSIPVDVSAILETGDGSRDVALQWGDAVEIPETDHPISDVWQGFTANAGTNLIRCISRSVKIVVQGTGTEFKPALEYATIDPSGFNFTRIRSSFMVRAVLDQSKLIRFSSDLSCVKVTRRDPKTGKKIGWVLDCSGDHAPDLWLRDGDVIEVPEK